MNKLEAVEKSCHDVWLRVACWVLLSCVVLTLAAVGLFPLTVQSMFLKLLPAPSFEVIELVGTTSDGIIIDCHGGWFNGGKLTKLIIRSKKNGAKWERPENIIIRDCRIRGSIRIMGMGRNGEAVDVRESSILEAHTARAQTAAPARILISNVEIEAHHGIPLYLAPGVTYVTFENSRLTGWSRSVGIYLDAESGHNIIRNNTFTIRTGREVIAVDGSAANQIEGNRFEFLLFGGIYLYRNCGEGGTVRHQTPCRNKISNNSFNTQSLGFRSYGIWLGSRKGKRIYCHEDDGYPFGSSKDNQDFADENQVTGNIFSPQTDRAIRNDGRNNLVDDPSPHSPSPKIKSPNTRSSSSLRSTGSRPRFGRQPPAAWIHPTPLAFQRNSS